MTANNVSGLVTNIRFDKINSSTGTDVVDTSHGTLAYTYDSNGNIKSIYENSSLKLSYTYDGLNQLVRENNVYLNKSITYTYDLGGNILNKKEYAYTTGTLGTVQKTITYTYGDTNWKDKLTNYNGKAITYDAIGNPLTYDGYTYTWQKGRQLASISGNSQSLTFKYNQDGLRTKKINGTTTTEYLYSGDLLMQETDGTKTLNYLHDSNGEMLGVQYNGTNYYYMHNVQGDVIALYDSNGDITCRYIYDSWGKLISITDESGEDITSSTHIANVNPIRYRGYYYDTETGLYYLQSRYYNPDWCRFLNADDSKILNFDQSNVLQYNSFAYCFNNPNNNVDPSGNIAVSVVVGGIFGAVLQAVLYYIEYRLGLRKWNGWHFAGHIALGAALGAVGKWSTNWIKLARLGKMASKLKISQPALKFVLSCTVKGAKFAVHAIAKRFTRKPGENWSKFIKRHFALG